MRRSINQLTQLVEKLIVKVEQDDSVFHKLVKSDQFQRELQEELELLKKDPSQFTDLSEAYRKQKTQWPNDAAASLRAEK
jgi:hypothetical protein